MPCAGLTAGKDRQYGDMVKLAATLDSNSSVERRVGSNPTIPTSSFADGQVLEYWQIGKTVDCWTDSFYMLPWRNWQYASVLKTDVERRAGSTPAGSTDIRV